MAVSPTLCEPRTVMSSCIALGRSFERVSVHVYLHYPARETPTSAVFLLLMATHRGSNSPPEQVAVAADISPNINLNDQVPERDASATVDWRGLRGMGEHGPPQLRSCRRVVRGRLCGPLVAWES